MSGKNKNKLLLVARSRPHGDWCPVSLALLSIIQDAVIEMPELLEFDEVVRKVRLTPAGCIVVKYVQKFAEEDGQ